MNNYRYIAPCHFGLEKTLSFEVKKAGGIEVSVSDGRVCFSGDAAVCAKANIRLSTAERVCIILGQFRAETFEQLFEGILALPLSEYIGRNCSFPNSGHSINSALQSVPAVQRTIKKAMVNNLGRAYGLHSLPENGAECRIRFSLIKNEFTLMLDTSGEGLHKRGYRRESNAAPIRETLAAGIADIARVREGDYVRDPFCGSGTLLIEAAYKALNIAPGLRRHFSGEHLDFLPKNVWKDAREEASSEIKNSADFRAEGSDIDPACVELTIENAKKAGVEKYVTAKKQDIANFVYPSRTVKVLANPPYGERLLEVNEARRLYAVMGKRMLPRGENAIHVITPDESYEQTFGAKADKNRKLYNGMMLCRLYSFFK